MFKKKLLIPIIVLLFICSLAVLKLIVFRNPSEFGPTKVSPTLSIFKLPSNWQTYDNVDYQLHFQYPSESNIKELPDLAPNFLQVNLLKGQKAQAIIMVRGDYEPKDVDDFVGAKPEKEKKINGQNWYFFYFFQGYSNSPPFTAYQNEKDGFLYSFKFYDLVTDELRDQIIATVQISL